MSPTLSSGNNYDDKHFAGLRLEGKILERITFHDCSFEECALSEAVFRHCRFANCAFRVCDLSLVSLPGSVFSGVRFDSCKLIGVDWTRADWEAVRLGRPFDFVHCTLNHATFIGLDLRGVQFKDCQAVDVDFREATLAEADFGGSNLDQSLFGNTDLSQANFRGAHNYHINPVANTVRGARFALPEAMALLDAMDIVLSEESDG